MVARLNQDRVKFISYDGEYPNLCTGVLTLEIDGERCEFGLEKEYKIFWTSGGGFISSYDYMFTGEWMISEKDLPDKYKCLVDEIDTVFNDNVEYGCCGGCI